MTVPRQHRNHDCGGFPWQTDQIIPKAHVCYAHVPQTGLIACFCFLSRGGVRPVGLWVAPGAVLRSEKKNLPASGYLHSAPAGEYLPSAIGQAASVDHQLPRVPSVDCQPRSISPTPATVHLRPSFVTKQDSTILRTALKDQGPPAWHRGQHLLPPPGGHPQDRVPTPELQGGPGTSWAAKSWDRAIPPCGAHASSPAQDTSAREDTGPRGARRLGG